jgi:hypothetical protein
VLGLLIVGGAFVYVRRKRSREGERLIHVSSAKGASDATSDGVELQAVAADGGTPSAARASATATRYWWSGVADVFYATRSKLEASGARRAASRAAAREAEERRAAMSGMLANLERAISKALSSPGEEVVAELETMIEEAEASGVDELKVSEARRRLREAQTLVDERAKVGARDRMGAQLADIDAAARRATDPDGGLELLRYVYRHHPPKKRSLTNEQLRDLQGSEATRRALLKAQRDYHPDRNAALVRETLNCSSDEWEVLCLAICQHLAQIYDRFYKGEREFDDAENV